VNSRVKDDVNRILQHCLKKCAKCDSKGNPVHKVRLIWTRTDKSGKQLDLGANHWFNPTRYDFQLEAVTKGPMGRTVGNQTFINPARINLDAEGNNRDPDRSLATVIAHEVFHHGIGGTTGHRNPDGFVDSWPAIVGGVLSEKACKELCDELDID
jgi:hypothetical protein